MSLDFALVIRGDAAGAKTAAGETTAAVRSIGVEAARSSAALTAANDQAVASSRRVTDALTGQEAMQKRIQGIVAAYAGIKGPTDDASYRQRAADISAYGAALDRIRATYDPLFAAQTRHRTAMEAINQAERTGAISASLAIEARLRETASLNSQISALNGLAAAQKNAAQSMVNRVTIVPDRDSDIAAYGDELDRLRARFNPLYAASKQYETELTELNQAHKVGAFTSTKEYDVALENLNNRYTVLGRASMQTASGLVSVGGAARLTSNQLLRLSQQGNDVVTMWALGAPGMMIFASQAGQIYDALEGGPKGLRGSLAAVKGSIVSAGASFISFAGPLGLIATGIGVAGAAFAAYSILSREKVKSVDELLKEHEKNIRALGNAYGDVASKAKVAGNESLAAFQISSSSTTAGLQLALTQQTRELMPEVGNLVTPGRSAGGFLRITEEFKPFTDAITYLQDTAKKGAPDVLGFRKMVEERWTLDPNSDAITKAAAKLLDLTNRSVELAEALRQADIIKQRLFNDIGPTGTLLSQGTSNRADAGNLALYQTQAAIARARSQAAYDAEIQSMRARSPDEKAAAASAQASATYNDSESVADRRQRIELAGSRALVTAQHELAEAQKERFRSLDQTLASQQLDISLIGKTAGETARLRMEFELTSQVRAEAARNNVAVDEAEILRIKEKAAEYGKQAEAFARANLGRDLQFERDQLGRSPIEATVADRLKSSGLAVDLNSPEASAIRINELLKEQKKIWEDIRDTGVDAIGGIVDSATHGFSDIDDELKSIADDLLKQFTELAIKNPLANAVYGKGLPTLDSVGGVGGFIKTLVGGGMPDATGAGQALSTATFTAGIVNITGPIGVGGGTDGPLGAIARLLSGANGNAAATTSAGGIGGDIWNFFAGKGLKGHQIAGIMGNLNAESGLNPNAVNPNGGATGLPQWLGSRLSGLLSDNGGKIPGVGGQLDYIWKELQGPENGVLKKLLASTDVRGATGAFAGFERAEGWSQLKPENIALWNKRLDGAQSALTKFGGITASASSNLGQFGGGLGKLGSALNQFPAAPAGGGGIGSWFSSLFGGGSAISPLASADIASGSWGLFDRGGDTGGNNPSKVAGLVHEKEYVMDAPTVRALGVPFLDNLRRAAKSGRGYAEGGYAMAGYSSSSSAGSWSSQQSQPAKIERHYHDYAGVSVREEQSDNGKGGVREDIIIERKIADAMGRRNSAPNKALSARTGPQRGPLR